MPQSFSPSLLNNRPFPAHPEPVKPPTCKTPSNTNKPKAILLQKLGIVITSHPLNWK